MTDYTLVHALADGELSGEEKLAAEALIASDPIANREFEAALQIKQTLSKQPPIQPQPQSWKSCLRRLDELDGRHKVEGFVSKYAWGMCTIIFALIMSAGLMRHYGGRTVATGDMARYAASLQPFSRSAPSQDMNSWIRNVSSGAPIQLHSSSLRVLSYAQGYDEDRLTTVLYCQDALGPITLIIVKGANQISGAESLDGQTQYLAGQIGVTNCLCWTKSGFAMTLVGNRSYQDLAKLAEGVVVR